MSSVASMKPPDTLLVVFDSIAVIFGPPRAAAYCRKWEKFAGVKSGNAVGMDVQMSGWDLDLDLFVFHSSNKFQPPDGGQVQMYEMQASN